MNLYTNTVLVSKSMLPINQQNRYSFGQVKLKLESIDNLATNFKLFVRMTSDPIVLESKKISGFKTEAIQ